MGQTVGHRPMARDVDADLFRLPLVDQLAQGLPLRFQVTACPSGIVEVAEGITIDRQTVEAAVLRFTVLPITVLVLPWTAIMKNQHRRAAGGENRLRREAEENRILGILAVDHDPHIDAGLAHQLGQEFVQPMLQDLIDGLHPLALGQDCARAVQDSALIPGRLRLNSAQDEQKAQAKRQDSESETVGHGGTSIVLERLAACFHVTTGRSLAACSAGSPRDGTPARSWGRRKPMPSGP